MIIKDLSFDIVQSSLKKEIAKSDDKILKRRMKAIDFYEGEHEQYIKSHFEHGPQLPIYTANITKRMVNARSLVYKDSPVRSNEKYNDYLPQDVDSKMRQMEKLNFLTGNMALLSSFTDQLNYYVIPYFYPVFVEGETDPKGVYYPLANLNDKTNRTYEFWSDELHFRFDQKGRFWNLEDEGVNPFGVMPVSFVSRDPELVDEFWQAGAVDIVSANEHVDILFQELMITARIDALGIKYATGVRDETPIKAGVDEVILLPDGVTLGRLEGGDTSKIIEIVKTVIQSTALNNHLVARFVDSEARSGVALKLENAENYEARQASINDVWYPFEQRRFQIDRAILKYHGINIDDELLIDFAEPQATIEPAEQRAEWDWLLKQGLITKKEILKQYDPDRFTDEEVDKVLTEVAAEQPSQTPLMDLLAS